MKNVVRGGAATIAALALSVSLAGTVQAAGSWDTQYPEVVAPLHAKPGDKGRIDVAVQVRTPGGWRAKRILRYYDDRVGGIRLHIGAKCSEHRQWNCLIVREVDRPKAWFWGTMRRTREYTRHIVLNRGYGVEPEVACHEGGHWGGLTHHEELPGCLGANTPNRERPSRYELRELRQAY